MSVNGERGAFGFYKNEYVRASDAAAAGQAAKEKVRASIRLNPTVTELDARSAMLEVDEIEEGFDEGDLLAEEGFIFFESEKRA